MDNFIVKFEADSTGEEMLNISIINLNDGKLYNGLVGRDTMMNPVFELIYSTIEELFTQVMAEGNNSISASVESAKFRSVMTVNIGKKVGNSIMQFSIARSRTVPIEGVDLLTVQADEIRFLKHCLNIKNPYLIHADHMPKLTEYMTRLSTYEKCEVELHAPIWSPRSAAAKKDNFEDQESLSLKRSLDAMHVSKAIVEDATTGFMYNMERINKVCIFCARDKAGACKEMYRCHTSTGMYTLAMCKNEIKSRSMSLFPGYITKMIEDEMDENEEDYVGLLSYPRNIEFDHGYNTTMSSPFAVRMHNYVTSHPQQKHEWFKCVLIIDKSTNTLIAVEEKAR